ncbi:hypothetical protein BQ8420_21410 [Nocardiopsis sp. JB363]|nr:hypothetical protein BQ8420_21410 [Nocardiopsis sp. JB363]
MRWPTTSRASSAADDETGDQDVHVNATVTDTVFRVTEPRRPVEVLPRR